MSDQNLIDISQDLSARNGRLPILSHLPDGEEVARTIDVGQLDLRARAIAGELQQAGYVGERAILLFTGDCDFFEAMLGCIYAGTIAVPVAIPSNDKRFDRLSSIVADARPAVVLASRSLAKKRPGWLEPGSVLGHLPWMFTPEVPDVSAALWSNRGTDPATIAYLQYTSGSTSVPKGVQITHANVIANSAAIRQAYGLGPESVLVSWLPHFHDMGLISAYLAPLCIGCRAYVLPPAAFIQKPSRWLRCVSRFSATITGAPDFAYRLSVDTFTAADAEELDLQALSVAFNGSEPLSAQTMRAFYARYAPYGLREGVLRPSYGLAEATLMVSCGGFDASNETRFDAAALSSGRVVAASQDDECARTLVGCGAPVADTQIVVMDPETQSVLDPGRVGEIWITGPGVARGYWGRPYESEKAFGRTVPGDLRSYLRSADLGFMHEGQVFITGRSDDVMIVRGQNHYPQDIERTATDSHTALTAAGAAAFVILRDGEPEVQLAVEVERAAMRSLDADGIAHAIQRAVAAQHDLSVATIAFLKPRGLPRTSSGKVRRHRVREWFMAGQLRLLALRSFAGRSNEVDRGRVARPPMPALLRSRARPSSREEAELEDRILAELASRLGAPRDQLRAEMPFAELGLNSMRAVELASDLGRALGVPLKETLTWDHPTPRALAQFLVAGEKRSEQRSSAKPVGPSPEIAVIGIGCRFPGEAHGPDRYWRVLSEGADCLVEVPETRWSRATLAASGVTPSELERMRWAGLIDDVDKFDAGLFGIAPREAVRMDPQQRILLETCWEALEHAGIPIHALAGSNTGVFVGISTQDYRARTSAYDQIDAYDGTGNAASIAANRVSYVFDLHGPSMAVDTACSSSLVAVDLAVRSLRSGACDLAIVGGVNLLLSPDVSIQLARAQMLSPTGRCSAFDAGADGYVRGEGCGVVVLRRLADALELCEPVIGCIVGTAVNQDGRSNGLTAPSGRAQESVIWAALSDAGVDPGAVSYVEAHGTGTPLGDPIELRAIAAVYGERRSDAEPLWVGSAKTNIGHLEAAAGIAGLIKVLLALDRGTIPPSLHFARANPRLEVAPAIRVPTEALAWPTSSAFAGVSSFGFGGTNAHVIARAHPAPSDLRLDRERTAFPELLLLSANSVAALKRSAERYVSYLSQDTSTPIADLCASAALGRSQLRHRAYAVGRTRQDLIRWLQAHVLKEESQLAPVHRPPPIVFLFSGQGSHYLGMGTELYASEPAFRTALARCDRCVQALSGWSLLSLLESGAPHPEEAERVQPLLFSIQFALVELWKTWGIVPDAVLGHSVGEYAAAQTAGVLAVEDALQLLVERGRLMDGLTERGGMLAVALDEDSALEAIGKYGKRVSIAALNGSSQTVLAGGDAELEAVRAELTVRGVRAAMLPVTHAFHSELMTPMLKEYRAALGRVRFQPPRMTFVSTLSGRTEDHEVASESYWLRHIREPVRFAGALQHASRDGRRIYVEIGPAGTLLAAGMRCIEAGEWLRSMRSGHEREQILDSLGRLYLCGTEVDWTAVMSSATSKVALPLYPFERTVFWHTGSERPRVPAAPVPHAASGSSDLEGLLNFVEALSERDAEAYLSSVCDAETDSHV